MQALIRENIRYFFYLMLFMLIGGILLLIWEKPEDILFFSENRTSWGNLFFRIVTHLGEAPVYFLCFFIAMFFQPRYAIAIAGTGLSVMGLSFVLKLLFAVDRPVAFFRKTDLIYQINFVEGVDLHSGATSFPSGHTMSAFALYSLLAFFLPKNTGYATAMFVLALIVGLSRVYLVQHFWQDVYAGALIGVLIAMLAFYIEEKSRRRQLLLMD
jgi:membrane-associated phospholipid phosphatase